MKLQEEFEGLFGNKPDLISQAPGRVNLIGEHIDYNNGLVLPFAIDSVARCAIRVRNDSKIKLVSKQISGPLIESEISSLSQKNDPDWTRYILGVLWSLEINSGVEILVDSDVPQGAGLSSSAALECSVAYGLNEAFSLGLSGKELALSAQRAENEFVGVPCGIMDQMISILGKAGHALLIDCLDLTTKSVPVKFDSNNLKLMVVDTQAHHALVDGGYAKRRAQCEQVANIFGLSSLRELSMSNLQTKSGELEQELFARARHVVSEIERVKNAESALVRDDFKAFGELLDQSHNSLRDDYGVSCPELDCAVEVARTEGALGARMVGGGFGGSAIALVRDGDTGRIASAIERSFAKNNFKTPRFFDAVASEGAKLVNGSN